MNYQFKIFSLLFLQGAFQFLKLYGYPDVIPTLCNRTNSVSKLCESRWTMELTNRQKEMKMWDG